MYVEGQFESRTNHLSFGPGGRARPVRVASGSVILRGDGRSCRSKARQFGKQSQNDPTNLLKAYAGPAVHRQTNASDKPSRGRAKKCCRQTDVLRCPEAVHWRPAEDFLRSGRVPVQSTKHHGRFDPARCDGIDANSAGRDFGRERTNETQERRFRRRIRRHERDAEKRCHRSSEQDVPVPSFDHLRERRACQAE